MFGLISMLSVEVEYVYTLLMWQVIGDDLGFKIGLCSSILKHTVPYD